MNFRLKTSKGTEEILKSLQNSTGLTWNILSRIAVAMSLNDPTIPAEVPDTSGIEIHRNTMTGEHDYVYKAIIRQHAGYHVPEEEYFPDLFNRHIERGIRMLEGEYKLFGNYDKLLTNLLKTGN
ncbi:DNA sulfur modification protein DndE [Solibacillus isronensis B3W22]|uniref:DNA sulfur modification protein DndE n=1 Tax=Solibacillus isronensis B3W22 TaxID=1224748 RepID=K1KT55_9BACL|nr:DNA sulfur modification protein DndE [Solibacillus isronensis]AMO86776.1 DNA sulfur modification protein DndE [Solibacillus silvestris]EKB45681.1 DNA sulfur modification protein DndE [Solibacillus isronensis B3W22]